MRRALPQRQRRTVGAWCFADHFGPDPDGRSGPPAIGPHPHCGLHTVTWLLEGELVHRDSLGSDQEIRPGQLNLMTAGHGVSHAEEAATSYRSGYHGVQLWVAQPETTRHGPAAFEHHAELPQVELDGALATVLVGGLVGMANAVSPARADTALVGADLRVRSGTTTVPLDSAFEHALVVLTGSVTVDGRSLDSGALGYLEPGRDQLELGASDVVRLLLLGGVPFESPVVMWWNFVGRSHEEMSAASRAWNVGSDRFGETDSSLARIPAPKTPWESGPS